eukprot:CAMPEP_0181471340 /NCGR_PEP_ID=MMETSP1110-20121109/39023_1 /TAXON_ID=174948 /ORGANISM="Symbiodinium sp., Strain CCMP421" /LENGTH=135 /DNA_ID=CAMNT_0023596353 /DNA_START=62 /DNA_END=468 /DNA_ORIENTATION=-
MTRATSSSMNLMTSCQAEAGIVMLHEELMLAGLSVPEATGFHDGEGNAGRHDVSFGLEVVEGRPAFVELVQEVVRSGRAHGAHIQQLLCGHAAAGEPKGINLRLRAKPVHFFGLAAFGIVALLHWERQAAGADRH